MCIITFNQLVMGYNINKINEIMTDSNLNNKNVPITFVL